MTDYPDHLLKPEPKRDRYGRYLIEGHAYTRATTIAATLDDTYRLGKWQQRMVAEGLTLRDDLWAQVHALDPYTDKQQYDAVCEAALEAAKANRGANLGTALHRFTQDYDLGRKQLADIPEPYRGLVFDYETLLAGNNVTFDLDHVEQIIAHVPGSSSKIKSTTGVAGTFDRVAHLHDGAKVVADIKTGTTLDWSWLYMSIQLAIYATHTHTYDPATDKLGPPIPGLDATRGLIIHLPSEGDEQPALYIIDLTHGFDAYLTAMETRGHRKASKKWGTPYGTTGIDPAVRRLDDAGMLPGIPEQREWLKGRMQLLPPRAVADLRNRWPDELPQPFPEIPTLDQIETLHELLTRVEALHELPFGEPRPGEQPIRRPKGA